MYLGGLGWGWIQKLSSYGSERFCKLAILETSYYLDISIYLTSVLV